MGYIVPGGQIPSPPPSGGGWWYKPVPLWGCPDNDVDCTGDGINHIYDSVLNDGQDTTPREDCATAAQAPPAPAYYYA